MCFWACCCVSIVLLCLPTHKCKHKHTPTDASRPPTNTQVPIISRTEYSLVDINDEGFVSSVLLLLLCVGGACLGAHQLCKHCLSVLCASNPHQPRVRACVCVRVSACVCVVTAQPINADRATCSHLLSLLALSTDQREKSRARNNHGADLTCISTFSDTCADRLISNAKTQTSLMAENGSMREDLKLPSGTPHYESLAEELQKCVDEGKDIQVVVLKVRVVLSWQQKKCNLTYHAARISSSHQQKSLLRVAHAKANALAVSGAQLSCSQFRTAPSLLQFLIQSHTTLAVHGH